jgi:hypothetical protein
MNELDHFKLFKSVFFKDNVIVYCNRGFIMMNKSGVKIHYIEVDGVDRI